MSRTRRRWSSASRTAPWTCGTQRSEYGSWTLWPRLVVAVLEPAVAQEVAQLARRRRPGPGAAGRAGRRPRRRRPCRAAPRRSSPPTTEAVRTSRSASASSSAPIAPISCVPLSSASPSLASSSSGSRPASRRASSAGTVVPVELDLAATDQRQRQVGQRREVARGADAALLGHDRVDAELEDGEEPVDDQRPAAAVTQRERVGAQQEHRADDLARERRPDAGRVAHQQVVAGARPTGRDRRRSSRGRRTRS